MGLQAEAKHVPSQHHVGTRIHLALDPGRRSEGPTSSAPASDRSRQPAKMVSVPAREKKGGGMAKKTVSSAVAVPNKRGGERRSASPRSRSPANAAVRTGNENVPHHNPQPQSLSRSSSRKAEQSPGRRNPMAEIDENSLRGNHNGSNNNNYKPGEERVRRKLRQSQTPKSSENSAQMGKSEQRAGGAMEDSNGLRSNNGIGSSVCERLICCHAKDRQPEPELVVVEGAVQAQGLRWMVGLLRRASRWKARTQEP